ncbi:MAG: ABC transporter ATP-binding protein [Blautia sp.]|nr:ABC transporter ATP-binding protein [Blautia sp.]
MIQIKDCSKRFDSVQAVDHVSLELNEKEVFGMVGSNGAGKSTLLRMMAGITRPDTGEILIDERPVYENEEAKRKLFYISDSNYFPANSTPRDLAMFFQNLYDSFDIQRFSKLTKQFQLDEARKVNTFSKGMKKQLSVILGISAGTKYLFCDETFDGLDPVMRQAVKSMFAAEIMNREFTPIIASHNLRELEDICDHVGLLHKGGILLSKNLEEMKFHIHRVQCVLTDDRQIEELRKEMDILQVRTQGSLRLITARGTRIEILQRIQAKNPLFCEVIPLSLEEIFISETEVAGYEIQNLFF